MRGLGGGHGHMRGSALPSMAAVTEEGGGEDGDEDEDGGSIAGSEQFLLSDAERAPARA